MITEMKSRTTLPRPDAGEFSCPMAANSFQHEPEERKRTEIQLKQRTNSLENEIDERKRMHLEVERVHREWVETSRQAGRAEVAAGVLHNARNMFNRVPFYLKQPAAQIAREQQVAASELGIERKNINHIKDIVPMQQSYAKFSAVVETVELTELIEDSLRINAPALMRLVQSDGPGKGATFTLSYFSNLH
jgi:hypothetical protein